MALVFNLTIPQLPNYQIPYASSQRRPAELQHAVYQLVPDCAEYSYLLVSGDARSAELGTVGSAVRRSAGALGGVSGGVASLHGATGGASLLHVDVSAWRVGARAGQHVVPLHLWGQCGGLPGAFQISCVLSDVRVDCDGHASGD